LIGLGLILKRDEIERKAHTLAAYGGFTDTGKVNQLIDKAWNLENQKNLNGFVF
jgi:aconitate decarboxylase